MSMGSCCSPPSQVPGVLDLETDSGTSSPLTESAGEFEVVRAR